MAHEIFLSHSSRDKAVADQVCAALEREGFSVWIAPRDILPGKDWGESIIDAINASKVLVIVFTAAANESKQVLREVERAVAKGISVIPFRTENILPSKSMEYFLSATHWLDAFDPPLERHLASLAHTVGTFLTQTPMVTGRGGAARQKTKAAEEGDPEAQNSLGLMFENGIDVSKSEAEAIRWFTRAAEQGLAEGQYNLARMYEGAGELAAAFEWYSRAAQQGFPQAVSWLERWQGGERGAVPHAAPEAEDAVAAEDGYLVTPARKRTRALVLGGVGLLVCLGLLGLGIADWLRKSRLTAAGDLPRLYEKAKLGDATARDALKEAGADGNPGAQFFVGRVYDNGVAGKRDEAEAVNWYRKAAEKGHVEAQLKLARMYEVGIAAERDPQSAFSWYRKAAEQGDASAQLKIADLYETGEGVAKDSGQAAGWYQKAAEQGSAVAQFKLAKMHEEGRGVAKDKGQAAYWYQKAAEQQYYYARPALARLAADAAAK